MPIDGSIPLQTRGVGPLISLGDLMQQAQQARIQREQADALAEQRRSMAEQRKQQTAKIEQENADRAATGEAIQQGGGVREQTLAWAREQAPNTVPGLTAFFDQSDKSAAELKKLHGDLNAARLNHLGHMADGVLQNGGTPEALQTALSLYSEQFPDEAQDVEAFAQRVKAMPPPQIAQYLQQQRAAAPYWQEQEAKKSTTPHVVGGALVDPTGKVLYQGPEKVAKPSSVQEYEYSQGQGYKGSFADYQNEDANRHRPVVNVNAGAGDGLDEAGQELLATQYRIIGTSAIPTRISGGDRARIINQAAAQMKALGQSPVMAIQRQAARKADAGSLTKITSMASTAEAFENKAIQQADLVRELSARVDRSRFPILNKALLAGKKDIAGDADTQLLYNALTTFTAEYAKIIEGSTGSAAGSSDAARRASASLASAAMNKDTLAKTLDLMQKEMRYTIQGYSATIDHITNRMGGAPAIAPPPPAAIPEEWVRDPKTHKLVKKGGT